MTLTKWKLRLSFIIIALVSCAALYKVLSLGTQIRTEMRLIHAKQQSGEIENGDNDKVTMIMMTYKRNHILLENPVLSNIVPLLQVARLLIIWNNIDEAVPHDL